MSFFKRILKSNEARTAKKEYSDDEIITDFKQKETGFQKVLGESSGEIGVASIPFRGGDIGGFVDMYYYPNHISGTGFATMQLLDPSGNGPKKNKFGTFELVAFTKHSYIPPGEKGATPYREIERRICETFSTIGKESFQKTFNPNEICEFVDSNGENRVVIFDIYQPNDIRFIVGKRKHHLLLCIEVFKEEINTINDFGPKMFIEMLKMQNHYPYSDMDRNWIGERKK